jgi:hypothetical protein
LDSIEKEKAYDLFEATFRAKTRKEITRFK